MLNQLLSNRYQILKKLGEGGFGTTYLAEDTQMPSRRRCVIKQLKPLTTSPQVYQLVKDRFQREAAILEELGARNSQIPQLYAYFEEHEEFYLVQEYIDGEPLSAKVEQFGPLDENTVKEILIRLLPVLEFVHSNRIVHRDIKPDNVIIRRSDYAPILIDFGAVKETMGTIMTTGGSTKSSIVIGTPGFMPSEQSVGRPVFASDLYALGLTAVYLLTGKTPYELENDPLTGELIWRNLVPNLNPVLADVLDKSIKSHHRERFQTAREMLKLLTESNSPATILPSNQPVTPDTTIPTALAPTQPPPSHSSLPTQAVLPQSSPENSTVIPPSVPVSSQGSDWTKAAIVSGIVGLVLTGVFVLFQRQQSQEFEKRMADIKQENQQQNHSPQSEASQQTIAKESPQTIIDSPDKPQDQQQQGQPLEEEQAVSTIENLYDLLSEKRYDEAVQIFTPNLADQFTPNFFDQFKRVSVENLRVDSFGKNEIKLIGENTYFYHDGKTQRELRSYTVIAVDGVPKITESEFIKVIKDKS